MLCRFGKILAEETLDQDLEQGVCQAENKVEATLKSILKAQRV
jgi:hypothetical protein